MAYLGHFASFSLSKSTCVVISLYEHFPTTEHFLFLATHRGAEQRNSNTCIEM